MTLTIPTSATELEEMLGDQNKVQNVLKEGKFGELVTNYARIVHNKDQDIADQIRNETRTVLRDWMKENGAELTKRPNLDLDPDNTKGPGLKAKGAAYNPKALGASLDSEFSGSSDFFKTIWHNTYKSNDVEARLTKLRNAFGSQVPSDGGFLIPENLRAELLRVSLETSVVRPRARVVPMESLRVPFPAVDSTSNVNSVYGGIVGYWTQEGASLTASQATFGQTVLEAKKLTAYTTVPNELVNDSAISFEMFINEVFPEALSFYEDDAFFNGNGVGEPLGFLTAGNAAAVEVAKESGQAADTIVWENIIKMYARMLPRSLNRAVWLVSPDTFPELATMALSVGTGGSAVWLNNGVEGPPAMILGRPVVITEKASVLGDAGDINFVDFGFYLIGDRQAMSASSSPHVEFQSDKTAYRIISRVDGRPWLNSAITPKNNGPALSPFVKLAARA